jgi:hypothetical protein
MGKRTGNPRGRPKGSKNKKTRRIAMEAAAKGITPLEVILEAMRRDYAAGLLDKAADRALDAAPYIHPRLTAQAPPQAAAKIFEVICRVKSGSRSSSNTSPESSSAPSTNSNGVGQSGGRH